MFDELVESSVVRKKTNKGWAVIFSTIVQVGFLDRLDIDSAHLHAGIAEGDAHDLARCTTAATAATATSCGDSNCGQACREVAESGRT
jgi:hypothetical protein